MTFSNLINFILGLYLIQTISFAYSQQCKSRYSPNYTGTCVTPSTCKGAILNNLCAGSLKCCITDKNYTPQNFVTSSQLKSITGINSARMEYISEVLRPAGTTCNQKSSFISQLAHESGNFNFDEEMRSEDYFKKYDIRDDLGNTKTGDGK
jgi:hypothetical protein